MDTKKALELGAVETLLISEDKDEKVMNELIELLPIEPIEISSGCSTKSLVYELRNSLTM